MTFDVACDECQRKGSGSQRDLLGDGWVENAPAGWLCPACVVVTQGGMSTPTVPPRSGRDPDRT